MRATTTLRVAWLVPLMATALTIVSCTSEKIVYRDNSGIGEPPTAAAKFVGYAKTDTKQTVCGTCHAGFQQKWQQTAHAGAWASLQASGHAASYCEPCHAVSKLGNGTIMDSVGWVATKDPRFQDVQCENCHGPGLDHVTAPSLGNTLLASIAVDTNLTNAKNGCGECHTGQHEPFVDQWKVSAHAYVSSEPASRAECQACHTGQAALAMMGVTTNYVEKSSTTPQAITCAVCHDPHSKEIDKQLRFSIATQDTAKNLCMKCHNRSNLPSWTTTRPMNQAGHAPETGTLLGYAGWFPEGYMTAPQDGGAIVATHGSSANTRTCATCHVARYQVTDSKGGLVLQATGHTFNATPCLDSLNRPLATDNCAITKRSFSACAASGCHATETAARGALQTAQLRIETLTEELEAMIANPKVPAKDKTDPRKTVARGAMFNTSIAAGGHGEEVLSRTGGNIYAGAAAHNPFLVEQLLLNSIKAMTATYGVSPSRSVPLTPTLSKGGH